MDTTLNSHKQPIAPELGQLGTYLKVHLELDNQLGVRLVEGSRVGVDLLEDSQFEAVGIVATYMGLVVMHKGHVRKQQVVITYMDFLVTAFFIQFY